MADEVRGLADAVAPVVTRLVYDKPLADDSESGRCDEVGLITKKLIFERTPVADAVLRLLCQIFVHQNRHKPSLIHAFDCVPLSNSSNIFVDLIAAMLCDRLTESLIFRAP